jgi:hypothetical protein
MNEVTRLTLRGGASVDEFLSRAAQAYNDQRQRIIAIEAEHKRLRTEVESDFGKKLADIAHEGTEALRKLDDEQAGVLAIERSKLQAIARLRHG